MIFDFDQNDSQNLDEQQPTVQNSLSKTEFHLLVQDQFCGRHFLLPIANVNNLPLRVRSFLACKSNLAVLIGLISTPFKQYT